MPELRRDPIVGQWVIVQTERVRRPADFRPPRTDGAPGPCLYCGGHEHETPPELLAVREGAHAKRDTPGWRVRVVPSKFPTLRVEGDLGRRGHGLYDLSNGVGAHEVVVESPDHGASLATLPPDAVEAVIGTWRDRMLDLRRDTRFRSIVVVRRHRTGADVARGHPHSVVLATPMLPLIVSEELAQARAYYEYRERCPFCDVLQQELDEEARLVAAGEQVVAFAPFAARVPFETWFMPRRHGASFERSDPAVLTDLARVLHVVLRKLAATLDDPPFTLVLHTAPAGEMESVYYHWHVELVPALAQGPAVVEAGGFALNALPPEDAARYLRDCAV